MRLKPERREEKQSKGSHQTLGIKKGGKPTACMYSSVSMMSFVFVFIFLGLHKTLFTMKPHSNFFFSMSLNVYLKQGQASSKTEVDKILLLGCCVLCDSSL